MEPIERVQVPDLFGAPTPEGFVSFNEGFGKIPGPIPSPPARAGFDPAIEWATELPAHPTEVTILRMHQTLPDSSFLQNITTALRMPAGVLQSNPVAESMSMQWRDKDGYRWSYDAEESRITFERIAQADVFTVNALPTNDWIISIAEVFMTERGVDRRAWGKPQLVFSWNDWWLYMRQGHRCMTFASVGAMRELAQNDSLTQPALPTLPFDTNVECVQPEFPSRHVINYHLSQDGQEVFGATGERVVAAELIVDLSTDLIQSGWFDLVQDVDRSNYPVLPLKETIVNLQRGGLRGTRSYGTADVITITEFERGLYRHDTEVDGTKRTYFIPGIHASGDVELSDGGKEEFQTFVPLLREDAYAE
jgi:hypothetical protein